MELKILEIKAKRQATMDMKNQNEVINFISYSRNDEKLV